MVDPLSEDALYCYVCADGRFMAGLISGGQTVAVALQETLDADCVTTGTVVATRAGTWGLGVYLQTSDDRCAAWTASGCRRSWARLTRHSVDAVSIKHCEFVRSPGKSFIKLMFAVCCGACRVSPLLGTGG